MRSNLGLPCPLMVTPDGAAIRDGLPIDMSERTRECGRDAYFMIGRQVCCEQHLRELDSAGLFPGLAADIDALNQEAADAR